MDFVQALVDDLAFSPNASVIASTRIAFPALLAWLESGQRFDLLETLGVG